MVSTQIYFSGGKVLTVLTDFDGGSRPVYIGEAEPGTATSKAKWRIQKRTYDAKGLTAIKWANGTGNFDNIYDDRATFSYS